MFGFAVYGFFIQGVFSWTPIWLPELFPTRMRATAAGFIFNAPRLISAIAPLIAGSLIVGLGGYGKTATIIGLFYILGLFTMPFLPETKKENRCRKPTRSQCRKQRRDCSNRLERVQEALRKRPQSDGPPKSRCPAQGRASSTSNR